jgi:tetratricopeptide (TPR) repeat protein
MALPDDQQEAIVAILPLVGNRQTDDANWLGGLLSKLLVEHLLEARLPVMEYNRSSAYLVTNKIPLPIIPQALERLQRDLSLQAVVHGRYVLDEDSKMLGFRLLVEAPQSPQIPLEVAAPLSTFPDFIERMTLSIIERLGVPIDDSVRAEVHAVARPASFEAFRQLANAHLAWTHKDYQLALTAVTSALSLDPDLDEAAALEVALARLTNDNAMIRSAFRRWSAIASRQRQPLIAAERLVMLGHWLLEHGEWENSHQAYEEAQKVLGREPSEYIKAQIADNMSGLEMLSGRLQSAIQTLRRSLRTFEAEPDSAEDVAITYYNLALAHKGLGQPEEAERALQEAIARAKAMKDSALEGKSLALRGALYDDQGQWAKASADYQQALLLLADDPVHSAIIKSHQGIIRQEQGDFAQAETLMLEALRTFEAGKYPHEQAIIWLNLADLYLASGSYAPAWEYARKAHDTFTRLKSGWVSRSRQVLKVLEGLPAPEPPAETQPDSSSSSLDAGTSEGGEDSESPELPAESDQ